MPASLWLIFRLYGVVLIRHCPTAYQHANRLHVPSQRLPDVQRHFQRGARLYEDQRQLYGGKQIDWPKPMKIVVGVDATALATAWKGVAIEVGKERIWTRTGLWSKRDSVKNLA